MGRYNGGKLILPFAPPRNFPRFFRPDRFPMLLRRWMTESNKSYQDLVTIVGPDDTDQRMTAQALRCLVYRLLKGKQLFITETIYLRLTRAMINDGALVLSRSGSFWVAPDDVSREILPEELLDAGIEDERR